MNLYRTEYVLVLDIGFIHTNDTSCVYGIRVHGHDGTSEYSLKVLDYLKNTVGESMKDLYLFPRYGYWALASTSKYNTHNIQEP